MKTPKRYHTTPQESWSEDYIEYRHDIELSRWHRKNRIRQLKHTIAKYKVWYEATRDILRNVSLELKAMQDEYLPK